MRSEIRAEPVAGAASLLDAPLNPRTASRALARFELFGGRFNNFIAGHLPPAVDALIKLLKSRLFPGAREVVSGGGELSERAGGQAAQAAAHSADERPPRDGAARPLAPTSWFWREERLLSVSGNCAQVIARAVSRAALLKGRAARYPPSRVASPSLTARALFCLCNLPRARLFPSPLPSRRVAVDHIRPAVGRARPTAAARAESGAD